MKSNYKKLGSYIQLVDNRNRDLSITDLLGVSIEKRFIPSIANHDSEECIISSS